MPPAQRAGIGDAPVSAGRSGVGEAERPVTVAARQAPADQERPR